MRILDYLGFVLLVAWIIDKIRFCNTSKKRVRISIIGFSVITTIAIVLRFEKMDFVLWFELWFLFWADSYWPSSGSGIIYYLHRGHHRGQA